jgi:hypothetical protein
LVIGWWWRLLRVLRLAGSLVLWLIWGLILGWLLVWWRLADYGGLGEGGGGDAGQRYGAEYFVHGVMLDPSPGRCCFAMQLYRQRFGEEVVVVWGMGQLRLRSRIWME